MPDDLTDQLRRYGAALGEHLDAPTPAVVDVSSRRRRWFLAPAGAVAVIALVVATLALSRDGGDDVTVPVSTEDERQGSTTTTTTTIDRSAPSSTVPRPEATTPPATAPLPPTSTSTTTTMPPPRATGSTQLAGTATWIGRDPRAALRVAACPATDTSPNCPSMFTVPVADDGTFVLTLRHDPAEWRIAAYVTIRPGCVFSCVWPNAPTSGIRSDVVTVDVTTAPGPLSFSVAARVVDVVVRDRNGDPFEGGGVMVEDVRCKPDHVCADGSTMMMAHASPTDGATRLVLHPDVTYELTGLAGGTGWPDPAWVSPEGTEFWFTPTAPITTGAALDEGHVFSIDGAPAS